MIIIANYAFYVFGAAIANFDVISFENTVKFLFFGGSAYLKDEESNDQFSIFVYTVLLNERLNQIIFLLEIYSIDSIDSYIV